MKTNRFMIWATPPKAVSDEMTYDEFLEWPRSNASSASVMAFDQAEFCALANSPALDRISDICDAYLEIGEEGDIEDRNAIQQAHQEILQISISEPEGERKTLLTSLASVFAESIAKGTPISYRF